MARVYELSFADGVRKLWRIAAWHRSDVQSPARHLLEVDDLDHTHAYGSLA